MEVLLNSRRTCRICLCEKEFLVNIFVNDIQFDRKLSTMISTCSDMKIHENDNLPKNICSICVESARNAFAFRQQCDAANQTLQSLSVRYNLKKEQMEYKLENTKGTQTDGDHKMVKSSENSLFVEVEYLNDDASRVSDQGDIVASDGAAPCKLEVFENVEFLAENFDEVVETIKSEPSIDFDCPVDDSEGLNENQNDCDKLDRSDELSTERHPKEGSRGRHHCEYCEKSFGRSTHLRRHMFTHTKEKPFKCKICAKPFSRSDHLAIHESTFHSLARPFACQLCEKAFKRAEYLRDHMESKHNETAAAKNLESCDICQKGFPTVKTLASHRKKHFQQKVHTCGECGKQFQNRIDHRNHMKQEHSQGKEFLCADCGQSFVRVDYLQIHMRRHKGIKPYKCKFCPKAFPRATDLKVHEKYHTNEKPHLCNICGKGFHRAYNLLVHSRTHNGLKPYKCPHCVKCFAQGNDLKAHVRRHTGERYKCDLCSEGFIQVYQLNNHKRQVHNIDTAASVGRVSKYITATAQEQQVLLQQHHQQLEKLFAQKKSLEQQQKECNVEHIGSDASLERRILETDERIQGVEREIEEINNRLHKELGRQNELQTMREENNEEYNPDTKLNLQSSMQQEPEFDCRFINYLSALEDYNNGENPVNRLRHTII
ncbi:zinc finger protein 436-like [Toxorhynchites rutilus septentrionalis]|uniref:zinc finger protein 436-like n=1 Tax=Toxorhynchites rutilus septentrionalis TaxID=329112 RepID=UPI00247A7268|nr:zinc finger protein 436-like [Toxorhynchites rutilus septentrionalis]